MLKKESKSLSLFIIIHVVITMLCSIGATLLLHRQGRLNFLLGEAYLWVSLISISLSVYLFFLKKNIALLVSVIVFKWPILIYVVFKVSEEVEISPAFLSLGFMPIFLSALIWSLFQKNR